MSDDIDATEENPLTTVTKEQVQERVQDWKCRLEALCESISAWAKENGWRVTERCSAGMHEELMQKLDVPATQQPTLRLAVRTAMRCSSRKASGSSALTDA